MTTYEMLMNHVSPEAWLEQLPVSPSQQEEEVLQESQQYFRDAWWFAEMLAPVVWECPETGQLWTQSTVRPVLHAES